MINDVRRLAVVVAVLFAAVSGMGEETRRDAASTDVVKELFPWFEIGETVDAAKVREAKLRGRDDPAPREGVALRHLFSHKGREGLRAHEQYLIVDARMPTNDMAWVTLSVPDRKVLQMRHDIDCGSIDAAKRYDLELQAKFNPLKFEGGSKLIEIMKVVDQDVCVQLSDAEYGKEVIDWLKKVE